MLTFLLIVGAMGGAIAYVVWNEKQMQGAIDSDQFYSDQ